MIYYDVFNGDADGILSLVQLRQVEPKDSILISGVKRDIDLLKQVPIQANNVITALDISMEKNSEALAKQLANNAQVLYIDHHRCGEIPKDSNLNALIDLDANACTALIVDQFLQGKKHFWAIAAAYGDNLIKVADELSSKAGLSKTEAEQLKELGTLVNYNGYGESLSDLHIEPAKLFYALVNYDSPFDCIADDDSVFYQLQSAYQQDLQNIQSIQPVEESDNIIVIELDNADWARRISGVYGNQLANDNPDKAIVVLTKNEDHSYRVSLRAPINNKQGAGDICSQFDTGGGRAAAAGINTLLENELLRLIKNIKSFY